MDPDSGRERTSAQRTGVSPNCTRLIAACGRGLHHSENCASVTTARVCGPDAPFRLAWGALEAAAAT
eukprot:317654-Chlamydomonas_euryale.AAC.1